MKHRHGTVFSIALVAAMTTALVGCNSNEPVTSDNTQASAAMAPAAPTLSEIQAKVKLNVEQTATVKAALADWQSVLAAAPARARFQHMRAGLDFVAKVAPSLDNEQLGNLVDFLVAYRDQHMKAAMASFRGMHGNGPRGNGPGFEARLAQSLGLNADQQQAMQALHQETWQKAQAQHEAFRNGSITHDQLAANVEAIHNDARQKLSTILTADQMKKLDALRTERRDQVLDRRMDKIGTGTGARVDWLTAVLGLSDAQKSQLQTALASTAAKQKAALQSLRDGSVAHKDARLQMRDNRDELDTALAGILTKDQAARLEIVRRLQPHMPRNL